MSNIQNEGWLESANDNFEEALEQGDWTLCESIIADVRDEGFKKESLIMQKKYSFSRFDDISI